MAVVYRYIEILTVGVVVFFRSPSVFHSQDSFPSTFRPRLLETSSGVVAVAVFATEAPFFSGTVYSRGLKFLQVIYDNFDCDLTHGFFSFMNSLNIFFMVT